MVVVGRTCHDGRQCRWFGTRCRDWHLGSDHVQLGRWRLGFRRLRLLLLLCDCSLRCADWGLLLLCLYGGGHRWRHPSVWWFRVRVHMADGRWTEYCGCCWLWRLLLQLLNGRHLSRRCRNDLCVRSNSFAYYRRLATSELHHTARFGHRRRLIGWLLDGDCLWHHSDGRMLNRLRFDGHRCYWNGGDLHSGCVLLTCVGRCRC